MEPSFSVENLIDAIEELPADPPVHSRVWYLTQKEHWLGWLSHYHGPGAYGRKPGLPRRDARFAYNHIVCAPMLLWLIKAAGVDRKLLAEANRAAAEHKVLSRKSAAIRRIVPWEALLPLLKSRQGIARSPASRGRSRGRSR